MDTVLEEKFINTFIDKRMRERIIFELKAEKYRRKTIIRFNRPEEILLPNCIVIKDKRLASIDITNEIKKHFNTNKEVYIFSDDASDGTVHKFEKALETVMYDYGVGIILCGDDTAFIKVESIYGLPMKYILHKN